MMISNMLVITSNILLFSRMISFSNTNFKLFPLEKFSERASQFSIDNIFHGDFSLFIPFSIF